MISTHFGVGGRGHQGRKGEQIRETQVGGGKEGKGFGGRHGRDMGSLGII